MSSDNGPGGLGEITRQARIDQVTGDRVEVAQSVVASVTGSEVSLRQSAVRQLAAEQAGLSQCASGVTRAGRVELRESAAFVAIGQHVSTENSRVLFLLSPNVTGPVAAGFTLPAAFALGFGYVLGRAFVRLLGKLLP